MDLNNGIPDMIVPTMIASWKRCWDVAILNKLDMLNIDAWIAAKANISSP